LACQHYKIYVRTLCSLITRSHTRPIK
jgi:hypothetical protein